MKKIWRFLLEPAPTDGDWNMAVDEYLFRTLLPEPRTAVRFYQWKRPTASLGYGQRPSQVVDLDFCRANGIDVVRRITGGKLVLHFREATYSVVSSDVDTFTATLGGSYQLISRGLLNGLALLGLSAVLADQAPPFYARGTLPCFSHPAQDEVEIEGRKIIGSAQKRIGDRFLQHGSIPLHGDEDLLKAVSFLRRDPSRIRMTSLSEALGRPIEFSETAARLIEGLASFFEVDFEPIVFDSTALSAIEDLRRRKYASEAWTLTAREEDPVSPVDTAI
jgi:lipoate-protein ligase A